MGLEKFERIIKNVSKTFEWVGIIAFLVMVGVNIIDVVGSKFFNWPFPGSIELISFAQVIAISLTISIGVFLGFHIAIDFIIMKAPKTLKKWIDFFAYIICFIFFILIFLQTLEFGYSLYISEEIGSTSGIPFYPFAFVVAIGILPLICYYLIQIIKCIFIFMSKEEVKV